MTKATEAQKRASAKYFQTHREAIYQRHLLWRTNNEDYRTKMRLYKAKARAAQREWRRLASIDVSGKNEF